MTTTIIAILVVLLTATGVFLVHRKTRRRRTPNADTNHETNHASNHETNGTRTTPDRVQRIGRAYADGEIDERTLKTAARAVGIDPDEARRRLQAASTTPAASTRRNVDRAKKRKKNKQAKRSRQANRR